MWCLGKYAVKKKGWVCAFAALAYTHSLDHTHTHTHTDSDSTPQKGWWVAKLLNRRNEEGKLVNIMLEVTTKVAQDSPPQDFEEIYILDTTTRASALESIKLLTPLLG
jgi:hypothetical protein